MGLDLEYIDGQTPLDDDEKHGLLIPEISTREELDEFEQKNIEQAIQWTLQKNFKKEEVFTELFVRDVHRKMYGEVWAWAGEFRKTDKNIGVDKWQIGTNLKTLLDDGLIWIEKKVYVPDELAIRFKHRLVSIHCFPNGNGRHSRLVADIIIDKIFNEQIFTWGSGNLVRSGNTRTNYLQGIKEADNGNFGTLISFARS
jgi:Fic-DOC domain mobile mystery protein B